MTPHTILNVDDRASVLYARQRTLRSQGFDVVDASTGAEAWHVALRLRPAAILLDVHLPDSDGRELCLRMRNDPVLRTIPVVLISSVLRDYESPDLQSWGAAHYVKEPIDADALAQALLTAIAGPGANT